MKSGSKSYKIRMFKANGCPELDPEHLALAVKYLKYTIDELGLNEHEVKIRLLGAAPNEPITTACYSPSTKASSTIVGDRHLIDWCRSLAHELTHMKQDLDGRLNKHHPEIGGEIEDEANVMSGRITKYFIKNILTAEDKRKLGLGGYGNDKLAESTGDDVDLQTATNIANSVYKPEDIVSIERIKKRLPDGDVGFQVVLKTSQYYMDIVKDRQGRWSYTNHGGPRSKQIAYHGPK